MIRAFVLSLSLLCMPALAHATVSAEDSKIIDTKVAAFFGTIQKGDSKGAYDAFMSPVMAEQQQAMRNLIGMTDQVVAFFDGPFTYEKVEEKELGSRLLYRKYLLLSQKAPYVVTLTMYHTDKGWVCQGLFMRDLTPEDFPEAAEH